MRNSFKEKLLKFVFIIILLVFAFKLYFNLVDEVTVNLKFFLFACILSGLITLIIIA